MDALDVEDVLAIIDGGLDQYPICNPAGVGTIGGSYGGVIATWLACHHSERFRAFSSECPVNNLLSAEWSSDIATTFRTEHGPSHIEDLHTYVDALAINAVLNIDSPCSSFTPTRTGATPSSRARNYGLQLSYWAKKSTSIDSPARTMNSREPDRLPNRCSAPRPSSTASPRS